MGLYSFSMVISMMMISILSTLQSVFAYTLNNQSASLDRRKIFKDAYRYIIIIIDCFNNDNYYQFLYYIGKLFSG